MKQCVRCLQWKDESEFNWRYKALGVRFVTCRGCQNGHRDNRCQRHRDQRLVGVSESAREYVYNYLLTHPCTVCGESDPRVLEFHYTDGKSWILSNVIGGGNALVAIQAEIAKCVVLCPNCRQKSPNDKLGWFRCRK